MILPPPLDFIEVDHSKDLVGTWTCLESDFAEALVINADGSVVSTGVEKGEYWDSVKGNIKTVNNKMKLTFEDGDNYEGRFEMICGEAFTIFDENGEHLTYRYCENDLADEVVGMWVCNDGLTDGITIMSYSDNGKTTMTTAVALGTSDPLVNHESDYVVAGNLVFMELPAANEEGKPMYTAALMTYIPNATSTGDIITHKKYVPFDGVLKGSVMSFLRIKQTLDFTGNKYAYKSAYVTNANGKDVDFTILGKTFNMANIAAADFDVVFGADLYMAELNGNSITHKFRPDGQDVEVVTPITVEGNKVTLDYSAVNPACRKVEMYMFQDQDNTQLHMYMHTNSFVNYFANLGIPGLIAEGKLDPSDTAAVEKVFADMESRVESINASFVFKVLK